MDLAGRSGGTRTPNPRFWRANSSSPEQGLNGAEGVKPQSGIQRLSRPLSNPCEDKPPDKMRSAPSLDKARSANRKGRKHQSQAKNTKATPKTQAPELRFYQVTDGRNTVGRIEQVGNSFVVFSLPDDLPLGTVRNFKAAIAAISAATGGGQ